MISEHMLVNITCSFRVHYWAVSTYGILIAFILQMRRGNLSRCNILTMKVKKTHVIRLIIDIHKSYLYIRMEVLKRPVIRLSGCFITKSVPQCGMANWFAICDTLQSPLSKSIRSHIIHCGHWNTHRCHCTEADELRIIIRHYLPL